MKHRVVNVTDFKARCLSLLDDVGTRGGTITITKRGRPIAIVGPAHGPGWRSPAGSWTGTLTVVGDLSKVDASHLWEVLDKTGRVRP